MKKKYLSIITLCLMTTYANSQNFQEVNFSNLNSGNGVFADIDNDGDLDILQYGDLNGSSISFNDGNGVFTLSSNTLPIAGDGSAIFLDVDNDNDLDFFISGGVGLNNNSQLFTNDGNGNFTLVNNTPFAPLYNCASDFADIDNDGDLDIILAGQSIGTYTTYLYKNDGNGNYTQVAGVPFIGASYGSVDFADIDGDNDMDVLITGYDGVNFLTNLYLNDGSGNFTSVAHPFPNLAVSDAVFFDIDGDSDLDVILSGDTNYNNPLAKTVLYTNDGSGNFTLISNTPFLDVLWSSIAVADIDNDNDLDVIILGDSSSVIPTAMDYITKLYTNDGNGNFTMDNSNQFPAQSLGYVTFADVDNNGYPDIQFLGSANMFMNNICLTDLSVSIANGVVLTANETNVTYQWIDCDNGNSIIPGETSQTFTPNVNGNYAVILTSGNCVDTSQCQSVSSVGLSSFNDIKVDVYPNPTSGNLSIKTNSNKNSTITVFNVNGKRVYSNYFVNSLTFNLNEPSGLYYVEIKSDNSVKTLKLVKL